VGSATVYTQGAIDTLLSSLVTGAHVDGSSHLILELKGGGTIDVGAITSLGGDLTDIAALSPLNDDVIQRKSGHWTNRTLAQYASDLSSSLLQPKDSDLTAIAALTPSNDDVLQRKAGAWTNRTMAQLAADLSASALQPKATDLTAIAALTPSNDDLLQRKAGAWTNRTLLQLWTDISPLVALNVAKASGTTRSTSTLSIDADLQVTLAASTKYKIRVAVNYLAATGGLKFTFTVPSGASGAYQVSMNLSGTGAGVFGFVWTNTTTGAATSGTNFGFILEGYLLTSSGGTFGLQWANGTGSNSTTLGGGSELSATPYV
jgi:hypothetical protein